MSLKGLFNARWPGVALFDLDGTLVDSAPDLAAAVDQMLEHLGGRSPAGLDKVRTWVATAPRFWCAGPWPEKPIGNPPPLKMRRCSTTP